VHSNIVIFTYLQSSIMHISARHIVISDSAAETVMFHIDHVTKTSDVIGSAVADGVCWMSPSGGATDAQSAYVTASHVTSPQTALTRTGSQLLTEIRLPATKLRTFYPPTLFARQIRHIDNLLMYHGVSQQNEFGFEKTDLSYILRSVVNELDAFQLLLIVNPFNASCSKLLLFEGFSAILV